MSETMSNQEYNQFVFDHVVDHEGRNTVVNCPMCGESANRNDYECCKSGSVNQHYTLDCPHCSHHECDRDGCLLCEMWDSEENEYDDTSWKLDAVVEFLIDTIEDKGFCPTLEWCALKSMVHANPNAYLMYRDSYIGMDQRKCVVSNQALIEYWKQQLLNARFAYRLNKRIEQAKRSETLTMTSQH
ncbi:hypothetical protein [Enterovibrio norvegicus]|uniref:hypothetical protein n=1 Tax=Enterovibrio norvegicus TaxID=188144 RepID=UPI00352E3288